jgi:hypothetical protein
VYRVDLFPEPQRTAHLWRDIAVKAGVGDPYLVQVESFTIRNDPMANGFDAAVEFPGHQIPRAAVINPDPGVPTFQGRKFDYLAYARFMARRPAPAYRRFRSVMPAWDNTPRQRERAGVIVGSTPKIYQAWLHEALERARNSAAGDERIVFINAWNEWGEGCHLEPDQHYGRQYLEATRAALK